jgi:ammonium transporter
VPPDVEPVDIVWLLVAAALVLFMQAGFTALESGLVRSKNSINVAVKNFANFLVAASLFWLFGFGLMFGRSAGEAIGSSSFFFDSKSSFLVAFFVFQLGFIGTATTLISGAVAERMRFGGYVALTIFVAGVTYPIFGHWAWQDRSLQGGAGGWLRDFGFMDFAGSTVVHSVGGWVALAAILILGPRLGRFGRGAVPIHGHDLPLTTVGVFILWVGWYGFNGGSTFGLTPDVPRIILNTTIAAAFGGVVGMALTWRLDRRPDAATIMNAALAGLVGITASANVMDPWRAAVIGAVAAVVMRAAVMLLDRLEIDDAVGAVPVHLAAGIWGTLAVALLGNVNAFTKADSRVEQLGIQLVGIATCCAWAFGISYVVLSLINRVVPFRVDPEGELAGLNIAEHGASTEIADLLYDMDVQRRSGDFDRPVRVEPHTEVGQIAAQYNRVLETIEQRTDSLQLLQRTAAAANESTSVNSALAVALDEVCRLTGWPVGHAFLVASDDPARLVSTGIWEMADPERYATFRTATEAESFHAGRGLAGLALEMRTPVMASADDTGTAATLAVVGDRGVLEPVRIPVRSERGRRAQEWRELGLGAGLAVPILAGETTVGVLEFFSGEPFPADPELLELLLSVGTQLGRVVERQRSEEARLLALIDNMPAAVYLRDLEGRFILVNREYEHSYGLRNDDIRGKTFPEVVMRASVHIDPAAAVQADRDVVESGKALRREWRLSREGNELVVSDVRFPVRDAAGEMVALAGIDIDITAQKRHEAELAELLRRVEIARDVANDAADAKSRFLANMSHELRTPLNAIIGFTRLVSRNAEGLPERQVGNLSKILVSAEHLLSLIDEILDLSRIDAGAITIDTGPVDVIDVLAEVADSFEPLLDRTRVQMYVGADPHIPTVVTDREKLKQILLNLFSNAVKYTDEGTVAMRARTGDGRLRIEVVDTGLGMSEEDVVRVFDEFHRSDSSLARQRRGTGLGLTISRRLARALGGDITVKSRFGVGSQFTLELPLSAEGDGMAA